MKSFLDGSAYKIASSFKLTEENHNSFFYNCYKIKSEKTDMVINSDINKILSLEPVKSSNDVKDLKALYD